uniref:Methyltransferase domain-containing protein n=1 Tax=Spongospora subterranea TaxID=70186 RepID=A0A0H5RD75_9EUKA|eukprot:CRZ06484.1 hypothetical protein [Spongospora subterranea]
MDGFTREFTETPDGLVWTVGTMLTKYFVEHQANILPGKRVLELGSGLGQLSVIFRKLGADVTSSEHPESFENLQRCLRDSDIEAVPLLWGVQSHCENLPPFDIIIGSEIIYDEQYHQDLVDTLIYLFKRNPKAIYYNAFADRPFSCMFFATASDAGFNIEEIVCDYDRLGLEPERVAIHRLTLISP